jgi:hypothetical protein
MKKTRFTEKQMARQILADVPSVQDIPAEEPQRPIARQRVSREEPVVAAERA